MFSRLLIQLTTKMTIVTNMFFLGWEEGGEAWKLWRRLLAWEKEHVIECCILLHPIVLQVKMSATCGCSFMLHQNSMFLVPITTCF